MGMFDEVSIKGGRIQIEGLPQDALSFMTFQTNDLVNCLGQYVLDEDGRFFILKDEQHDPISELALPGADLDLGKLEITPEDYTGELTLIGNLTYEGQVHVLELKVAIRQGRLISHEVLDHSVRDPLPGDKYTEHGYGLSRASLPRPDWMD